MSVQSKVKVTILFEIVSLDNIDCAYIKNLIKD